MNFFKTLNHKKLAAISLSVVIFSILNGYVIVPKLVKFMLKKVSQFKLKQPQFLSHEYSKMFEELATPTWITNASSI